MIRRQPNRGPATHGPQARPGPRPGRERGGAVRQTAGSPLWTAFGPVRGRYARWMPTVITVPVRAHVFRGAAVPPGRPGGSGLAAPSQDHGGSGSGALLRRRHAPSYIWQRRSDNAQDGYTLCDRSSRPVAGATAHIADLRACEIGASSDRGSAPTIRFCASPRGGRLVEAISGWGVY